MELSPIAHQRDQLAKTLIAEYLPPRYVVDMEDERTGAVLDETRVGHNVVGLHQIAQELQQSRETIREGLKGVDDVAVDTYIGLRTEESILPPLFRQLHHASEEEVGHQLSFTEWMAEHATDAQLLNVWQWHDKYLTDLDEDPTFKERVVAVKASYAEGSRLAVERGILHQGMAHDSTALDTVKIVHGSPLSAGMAASMAVADEKARLIQVRPDTTDYILHHELTHALNNGLHSAIDEGATDLAAMAIYNATHLDDTVTVEQSVYKEQIATLEAMERISGGIANLYELSRAQSGGGDAFDNTISYLVKVGNEVELPLGTALLLSAHDDMGYLVGQATGDMVARVAQTLLLRRTQFVEDMINHVDGKPAKTTVQDLTAHMVAPETLGKYDKSTILDGMQLAVTISKLMEPYVQDPTASDDGVDVF